MSERNKSLKPIVIWGHWGAPNPWKVIIIMEELGIPYDHRLVELSDVKKEPLIRVNPNGRLPAIEDPNTGIVLWESGAIILYLIEQYDASNILSYSTTTEKFQTHQWLFFQVSGQGPYFGQYTWFARFHPEKIASATDRYAKETERVIGVLDGWLQSRKWLVGDKCTFADLSFVTWSHIAEDVFSQFGKSDVLDKYPRYSNWCKAMNDRASVKEAVARIAAGRAEHGLPP